MTNKEEKRESVYRMLRAGVPDTKIRRVENLSKVQLSGYKASYTRMLNKKHEQLAEYIESLEPQQIEPAIEKLGIRSESGLENSVESEENNESERNLPDNGLNEARRIVAKLVADGKPYEKIYKHRSLREIPEGTITALIAHASRGTYEERELP